MAIIHRLAYVLSIVCVNSAYAALVTDNVAVGYTVAKLCSMSGLPPTISLNAQGGQPFSYATAFNITCNSNANIQLSLTSSNASSTQMRLKVNFQNKYINYSATINNTSFPSGVYQTITPNNPGQYQLALNFAAPDYAGTFRDTLTFTLTY